MLPRRPTGWSRPISSMRLQITAAKQVTRSDEGPCIVRLNHEDILLERETVRRTTLSPSFMALLVVQTGV